MVSGPEFCPSPEAGRDHKACSDVVQARGSDLSGCEAVLTQKLKSLELQNTLPGPAGPGPHKSLALDPSCLLTPPNTPQGSELAEADMREAARPPHKGSDGPMIRTRAQSEPAWLFSKVLGLLPGPRAHASYLVTKATRTQM